MNVALFLEIKNEYTEHLVDTLTPYIYEGLTSIYNEAVRLATEIKRKENILMIFQKLLQSINGWNQIRITEETNRIKNLSNTAEYLDDLIKAVIKSNIILLAYSNTISNIIGQSFYNSLTTVTFVHRCYTECGKDAHNNPYLFFHDIDAMDYKRNQIIIQQHIQSGIVKAIRKILPISIILKEYLVNSMNIIQEPQKIELIGNSREPTKDKYISPPNMLFKHETENKIDPILEKEVMKIIKTENNKSDKQKIQAIMNIDKILTSMEPNKFADLSVKNTSIKKTTPNIPSVKKQSDFEIAPYLVEKNNYENANLGKSDKKIINIDFEESDGNCSASKKSVSETTFPNRIMPNRYKKNNPETSERIDPTKINLIEDYGSLRLDLHKNTKK